MGGNPAKSAAWKQKRRDCGNRRQGAGLFDLQQKQNADLELKFSYRLARVTAV